VLHCSGDSDCQPQSKVVAIAMPFVGPELRVKESILCFQRIYVCMLF
jgi:hypothetical protein